METLKDRVVAKALLLPDEELKILIICLHETFHASKGESRGNRLEDAIRLHCYRLTTD